MPLPIPDPMFMPDRVYNLLAEVSTTNVTAFGVSRIRVENFTSDIVEMKVHFGLRMPELELIGNYSYYDMLMQHYYGSFCVTLQNGYIECDAKLEVTLNGELAAADIVMDLVSYNKMTISLEKAGVFGAFVNLLGESFFSAIKPYFLSVVSTNIRSNVNQHLKQLKIMFPNSIPPLDLAIAEFRKLAKVNSLDPYTFEPYQYASSIYSFDFTNIVITGFSSFYRIGDVKILLINHAVHVILNMGTEELKGSCDWEAGIAGILTKSGDLSFTVDYINVMISVNQSLDLRKKAQICDLDIRIGNIQLRMDGAGLLDYVAELGVNVLPNMLRYQIIQALEKPIRRHLQEVSESIDLEQFILAKLPQIDNRLDRINETVVIEDDFVDGLMLMDIIGDKELVL